MTSPGLCKTVTLRQSDGNDMMRRIEEQVPRVTATQLLHGFPLLAPLFLLLESGFRLPTRFV